MDELTFLIEGYRVAVQWDSPEVRAVVQQARLPNFQPCRGAEDAILRILRKGDRYELYVGDEISSTSPFRHLHYYLSRLLQFQVALNAHNLVFVHCGVIKYGQGLILIPGMSHSGKSTLVHALCGTGCTYYSDEYAVVEETGLVRPWPRPLSLRTAQRKTRDTLSAFELGWRPEQGSAKADLVLITSYQPDACWNPVPIRQGEALLELVANTVSAKAAPKRAIRHLSALVRGARSFRSPRSEATHVAAQIMNLARGV